MRVGAMPEGGGTGPRGHKRGEASVPEATTTVRPGSGDPAAAVKASLWSIRPIITMSRDGLTIIPVDSHRPNEVPDYLTLDQAQDTEGAITIDEADQRTVPTVDVVTGPTKVLIIDGDTIVGGAQNRVINVTILLPAAAKTPIPVSCLEQGRWNSGRRFAVGGKVDHRMRAMLAEQIGEQGGGVRADQGAIWSEIAHKQSRAALNSPTMALHDVYRSDETSIADLVASFPRPNSARGVAIAHGDRVVGVDLFDSAETLERQWPRLVQSAVLAHVDWQRMVASGALPKPRHQHPDPGAAGPHDPASQRRRSSGPSVTHLVGLGHDVRFKGPKIVGSAIVHDGRAIHVGLFRP